MHGKSATVANSAAQYAISRVLGDQQQQGQQVIDSAFEAKFAALVREMDAPAE